MNPFKRRHKKRKQQLKRRAMRFISRFMKWLKQVFVFRDGRRLYVDGARDQYGLPIAFAVDPHMIPEVVPDPITQLPVLTGRKIPVIIRLPTLQVIELIEAGVL